MSWLTWIVIGLVAGAIAKAVMPTTRYQSSGLVETVLPGIVGAFFGGWVWTLFLDSGSLNSVNSGSLFAALVGSCIMIGMMRLFHHSARAY